MNFTMPNLKHLLAAVLLLSTALGAHAERLKDIASISGVRSNQLIGYGLVKFITKRETAG